MQLPWRPGMDSFKTVFDPLDLEIIDQVYDVAWARIQARDPSRNTATDGRRQEALRRRSSASHVSRAPDTSTSTLSLRWSFRQHLSSLSQVRPGGSVTAWC